MDHTDIVSYRKLEDQLRELREAKDELEEQQGELQKMMTQLEEAKNLEAEERRRQEEEIRAKAEEIEEIRAVVEAKERETEELQQEVDMSKQKLEVPFRFQIQQCLISNSRRLLSPWLLPWPLHKKSSSAQRLPPLKIEIACSRNCELINVVHFRLFLLLPRRVLRRRSLIYRTSLSTPLTIER